MKCTHYAECVSPPFLWTQICENFFRRFKIILKFSVFAIISLPEQSSRAPSPEPQLTPIKFVQKGVLWNITPWLPEGSDNLAFLKASVHCTT